MANFCKVSPSTASDWPLSTLPTRPGPRIFRGSDRGRALRSTANPCPDSKSRCRATWSIRKHRTTSRRFSKLPLTLATASDVRPRTLSTWRNLTQPRPSVERPYACRATDLGSSSRPTSVSPSATSLVHMPAVRWSWPSEGAVHGWSGW